MPETTEIGTCCDCPGSGSGGGGVTVPTDCCANELPDTLFATVSGCYSGTVELVWNGGLAPPSWVGEAVMLGDTIRITISCVAANTMQLVWDKIAPPTTCSDTPISKTFPNYACDPFEFDTGPGAMRLLCGACGATLHRVIVTA